ncbi:MAG: hypothetical protein ACK4UJ_00565 [Leptonema sp. (in: bacteria)]
MGSKLQRISITGFKGQFFTQLLRAKVDAVIVGPATTAIDQPNLNFRWEPFDQNFLDSIQNYKNSFLKESKLNYQVSSQYYDEFLRGLWIFYKDIINSTYIFHYQPIRIFILGRYFDSFINFLEKQKQLEESTKQKFYFFVQKKYKEHYKNFDHDKNHFIDSPNLDDENFFKFLNEFLIEKNVQKVLFEAGVYFFEKLFSYIEPEDFIYHVKKEETVLNKSLKQPIFWDKSKYNLILKDKLLLGDHTIYSLRKLSTNFF